MSIKDETSHIVMEVVSYQVRPLRVGGGHGQTFGQHIDEMLAETMHKGDKVAEFRLVINDDDWERLKDALGKDQDFAVKSDY